jgi:hypothetical protein
MAFPMHWLNFRTSISTLLKLPYLRLFFMFYPSELLFLYSPTSDTGPKIGDSRPRIGLRAFVPRFEENEEDGCRSWSKVGTYPYYGTMMRAPAWAFVSWGNKAEGTRHLTPVRQRPTLSKSKEPLREHEKWMSRGLIIYEILCNGESKDD